MDTASQSRVDVCIHKPDLFRLRVIGATRDPVVDPMPATLHVHADLNVNERGNPGMYPACQVIGGRDSRRETLEDAVGFFIDTTDIEGNVTNKYAAVTTCGYLRI